MYNKTIVVGRLTADPELRQTANGHNVTSFSIAVDRPYSKDGEKEVDFLNIVAWRDTALFVCKYFTKGRPILVDGSIQTRQYTDKNGVERRTWEIIADQVRFTESKGAVQGESSPPAPLTDNTDDFAEVEDDGDLPF